MERKLVLPLLPKEEESTGLFWVQIKVYSTTEEQDTEAVRYCVTYKHKGEDLS